jgi:hypothetical protein
MLKQAMPIDAVGVHLIELSFVGIEEGNADWQEWIEDRTSPPRH